VLTRSSQRAGSGPPAPKKEGRSVWGRSPRTSKGLTNRTLAAPSPVVNVERELLDRRGGISLIKVSRGLLTQYVVEHGSRRWNFSLLFSAQGKFERLTKGESYGR
jgi:hypothetical protein